MVRNLRELAERSFDLVIIGGGIYGTTAAWDATQRGLSVAIIDRADFGSGHVVSTSAKTTHGGVRSLQTGHVSELRQFVRERRAFARIAPPSHRAPAVHHSDLYRVSCVTVWKAREFRLPALDAPTLIETATADSVVMPVPAEPPSGLWILALWTRDVDDGTDFRSHGDRITLIGFDSRQGGERVLLAESGSYAKPMVTPDGGRDRVLGAELGTGLCDLVGRGAPTSYWERIYLDVWAVPET